MIMPAVNVASWSARDPRRISFQERDHGSDFTSLHLEQAAADLRIRLIYSAVARPQGHGKIERLFALSPRS